MSVELTPGGTRGNELFKMPRPLLNAFNRLNVGIYRLFGGRVRLGGADLLLLSTMGAKTGQRRRTTLSWFPDGDAWLIVASRGGSASHPDWYVNMAKHPDRVAIEVGGREVRVRPESLKGAEREAAWQRIVSVAPNYAHYQEQTDREIPVIRLTPAR